MRLHRVQLQNIYSFEDAILTCDRRITAVIGPNDAGKTNILRAVDYVAGSTPKLDFSSEMQCQFSGGEPTISLSFIVDSNDIDPLSLLLNNARLPSSPFPLHVSCQRGSLALTFGDQQQTVLEPRANELLGGLIQSVFVQAQLRPLRARTPLTELVAGADSTEAKFFSVAGLTPTDLQYILRGRHQGQRALADAAERLTGLLRSAWKQDSSLELHIQPVGAGADDRQLEIRISDRSNADVSLDRRGEGLRWFLALFVQLQEVPARPALCKVFLVDEPGVYLHPAGQADLSSFLGKGLPDGTERQIIYTTHSPFMLDRTRPHQVRVVQRAEAEGPASSIIVDKPYHSHQKVLNFWEPFRRSIGLFLGDMGLLGERNLLVEGATDQIIFAHLAHIGREQVDLADWRIIPFGNKYALILIVKTCLEAGRDIAVIVDGDDAGREYLEALKQSDCGDIPIHTLAEFYRFSADDAAMCIEDFLSRTQYLLAVNDAYGEFPWYERVEDSTIEAMNIKVSITNHLDALFRDREWSDSKRHEFSKAYVSIHLASSDRRFDFQDFNGSFQAIARRLKERYGPIVLGTITDSGNEKTGSHPLLDGNAMEASPVAGPQLLQFADTVARDKGIGRDEVLTAMEQAIQKVGRSKYGQEYQEYDIRAEIDRRNGEVHLLRFREVVDTVENEATHIALDAAERLNSEAEIGDFVTDPLPSIDFGQIAAQAAKQLTVQKKLRNASAEPLNVPWAAVIALSVKRDLGIEQISVVAKGPAGEQQWRFSNQAVGDADQATASDQSSERLEHAEEHEDDDNKDDAIGTKLDNLGEGIKDIVVFDSWDRKWIKQTGSRFLMQGAGVIHIRGSHALERATSLAFTINYADGSGDSFTIPFSSGRTPADPWKRFFTDKKVGDIVQGIVTELSSETPAGFWVKVDQYGITGWVHISEISTEWIHDASEVVSPGDSISAKIIGLRPGTLALSLKDV
jgi:hypothetical protein